MVTLKNEPLKDNISMKDIAMLDTESNILDCYKLLHLHISPIGPKENLASTLDSLFQQNPAVFANILPRKEITIVAELSDKPQSYYVERKRDDQHPLLLQRLYLVATYQTKDKWHIYMPDSIRNRLKRMYEEDLKLYPELVEFDKLISRSNRLKDEADIFTATYYIVQEFGVNESPKAKANEFKGKFEQLKHDFQALAPQLKNVSKASMKKMIDNIDLYIESMGEMVKMQ